MEQDMTINEAYAMLEPLTAGRISIDLDTHSIPARRGLAAGTRTHSVEFSVWLVGDDGKWTSFDGATLRHAVEQAIAHLKPSTGNIIAASTAVADVAVIV